MKFKKTITLLTVGFFSGCSASSPCSQARLGKLSVEQIAQLRKARGPYETWSFLGLCNNNEGIVKRRRLNNFGGYKNTYYLVEANELPAILSEDEIESSTIDTPSFFWPSVTR